MSRPWRIEYEGAFYHVLSRGNEQRDIFYDDNDRGLFLDTVGETVERFEIDVFAFVLMSNHLLLRTNRANLSKTMQWLGVTYTRRLNNRHGRSGHLFQGRFKSILVENDAYMLELSCYIHRNPLRAGMVKRLGNYRWSSYLVYAYGRKGVEWLKTDLILSQFSGRERNRAYREKVQVYSGEERRLRENIRHGLYLGAEQFVDRIRSNYLSGEAHKEIPQQRKVAKRSNPGEIFKQACILLDCDLQKYRTSQRIYG